MRKLLPSTINRREVARKNREAVCRWVEEGISRLDVFRCKTQQDPYSDELDYLLEEARNDTVVSDNPDSP